MLNRKGSLEAFTQEVEVKRVECQKKLKNCHLAVMLWGERPISDSPLSNVRIKLRDELEARGHYVKFGEEICNNTSEYSFIGQIASQAEAFDIIFSIPTSIGSLAEAHSFFMLPSVSNKLIIYMNNKWKDEGFGGQSLVKLQSKVTATVKLYDEDTLEQDIIRTAIQEVNKIQEAIICFSQTSY